MAYSRVRVAAGHVGAGFDGKGAGETPPDLGPKPAPNRKRKEHEMPEWREAQEVFRTRDSIALRAVQEHPNDTVAAVFAALRYAYADIAEFIETREHPDDWGVPCVYTKDLRASLGMPPS